MRQKFLTFNIGHVAIIVTLIFNIGISYQKMVGLGEAMSDMKATAKEQADKVNAMATEIAAVKATQRAAGYRFRSPKDSEGP